MLDDIFDYKKTFEYIKMFEFIFIHLMSRELGCKISVCDSSAVVQTSLNLPTLTISPERLAHTYTREGVYF